MADAGVVAVLTRAPSAGGKSRLFSALGIPPDPALLQALLLDTLESVAAPGVRRVVAVEPAAAVGEIARLAGPGVGVIAQAAGSLGDRMAQVFTELLASGAGAVVLVGSDLPELQPSVVQAALDALSVDPSQLVIGPATDGGYYLIAATHRPEVFAGIAWGSGTVLDETLAAAERSGRRVHLLTAVSDVDTPADLHRVSRNTAGARRTAEWARRQGIV